MNREPVAHPGSLLQSLLLADSGLSQSVLARQLGFNQPQPVNELIKGKRGITPKMALLLERYTNGEYPAEFWLLAQLRWDLAQARKDMPGARIGLVQPRGTQGDTAARASEDLPGSLLELSTRLSPRAEQH